MKHKILIAIMLLMSATSFAQEDDDFFQSFQEFRSQIYSDYQNFLGEINADYAKFLREAWQQVLGEAPTPPPQPEPVKPVPPVILPDSEPAPQPDNREVPVTVAPPQPQPTPMPQPPAPIQEVTQPVPKLVNIVFYGLREQLRFDISLAPILTGTAEDNVADAWQQLCDGRANNLINDCLRLRGKRRLCDWAYAMFAKQVAQALYPDPRHTNERELMQMFILCQSGYKVHISKDSQGRLHTLVAADDILYGYPSWKIDDQVYYLLVKDSPIRSLFVMSQPFPGEQPMRMNIYEENLLGKQASAPRQLSSYKYPTAQASVTSSKSLVEFYDTYPECFRNSDPLSRWWFYAQAPLSEPAQNSLYPRLRAAIQGKGSLEAVSILLDFVQTAFEYRTDDEVWGSDRPFFAEETLFYPYSDCEDRSILFSRLVRDLTGLDVVLVYCPGHLFAAVHFPSAVEGDYITVAGRRYTVADPTYIHAPVGLTMPDLQTDQAQAIPLR